ncbi:MAG: NAD(P)H-dependent oxidoreductase subunit E [Candidatus Planktophila sp.]|nr:NAD(P)H-dependent oxidoreductase subunit E [Candidatus Planktophila sp.]
MKYSTWSHERAVALLATLREEKGAVLMALQLMQREFGYVDKACVELIAQLFNKTRADVHGVLTFYHDLRTTPPPPHEISICVAEACQAVGARELEREVKGKFPQETRESYCFGNCALGPAAMVDGMLIGRASLEKIEKARQ